MHQFSVRRIPGTASAAPGKLTVTVGLRPRRRTLRRPTLWSVLSCSTSYSAVLSAAAGRLSKIEFRPAVVLPAGVAGAPLGACIRTELRRS